MEQMRINKYISTAGYCSRRKADELIERGLVLINGIPAVAGSKVGDDDRVTVEGHAIKPVTDKRIYALYKPEGYITSLSDAQGESITALIDEHIRLYPVGRLDKDSEGLLLMTNDGDFMNRVLKASNGHEKEYIVKVDKPITDSAITKLSEGVEILNKATGQKVITAPCKVTKLDDKSFKIILITGLNRQIRRMCEAVGLRVINLKRVRIMTVELGKLNPGSYREITGAEYDELMKAVRNFNG